VIRSSQPVERKPLDFSGCEHLCYRGVFTELDKVRQIRRLIQSDIANVSKPVIPNRGAVAH